MLEKLHNDPHAECLWRRCRRDGDLRWLLEGVLAARRPELGRSLLLSPADIFGEAQARVGNLPLIFRLTGFPYLSGTARELSRSLKQAMTGRHSGSRAALAKHAIDEWAAANGRQALDLIAAALLETVRINPALRALANSDEPTSPTLIARTVQDYEALDWSAAQDLVRLFEPFLLRRPSKKHINRFALNFSALLSYYAPELTQWDLTYRSALHFVGLLKRRGISESAWRELLLRLIDRGLVAPSASMLLWCRRFPEDGFVASRPFALGTLPPFCPSCGDEAHAIASFMPDGGLLDAMNLKDGLLGAAIGWHLTRRGTRFWHARCEKGTELDFIAVLKDSIFLIECKILGVAAPMKQVARKLRDAVRQLDDHADLLRSQGWNLAGSVCAVNLADDDLVSLTGRGFLAPATAQRLVSYERFSHWLRSKESR